MRAAALPSAAVSLTRWCPCGSCMNQQVTCAVERMVEVFSTCIMQARQHTIAHLQKTSVGLPAAPFDKK